MIHSCCLSADQIVSMWRAVFEGFEERGHPVEFAHVNRALLINESKDGKDNAPALPRKSASGMSFALFDLDLPSSKMDFLPKIDMSELKAPGVKSMSLDFSLPQVRASLSISIHLLHSSKAWEITCIRNIPVYRPRSTSHSLFLGVRSIILDRCSRNSEMTSQTHGISSLCEYQR